MRLLRSLSERPLSSTLTLRPMFRSYSQHLADNRVHTSRSADTTAASSSCCGPTPPNPPYCSPTATGRTARRSYLPAGNQTFSSLPTTYLRARRSAAGSRPRRRAPESLRSTQRVLLDSGLPRRPPPSVRTRRRPLRASSPARRSVGVRHRPRPARPQGLALARGRRERLVQLRL